MSKTGFLGVKAISPAEDRQYEARRVGYVHGYAFSRIVTARPFNPFAVLEMCYKPPGNDRLADFYDIGWQEGMTNAGPAAGHENPAVQSIMDEAEKILASSGFFSSLWSRN